MASWHGWRTVIEVRVTRDDLTVVVTGVDAWLLALRPRWEVTVPMALS